MSNYGAEAALPNDGANEERPNDEAKLAKVAYTLHNDGAERVAAPNDGADVAIDVAT